VDNAAVAAERVGAVLAAQHDSMS